MMLHEGVRDQADDADRIRPEAPIEFFLEKTTRGVPSSFVLSRSYRDPQSIQQLRRVRQAALSSHRPHPVEGIRFGRRLGHGRAADQIRQRKIEKICAILFEQLDAASSTNSDKSRLHMSGVDRPTSTSTFSIPFSVRVALPAFSDEKQIPPSHTVASILRSLSLAVTAATRHVGARHFGEDRRPHASDSHQQS